VNYWHIPLVSMASVLKNANTLRKALHTGNGLSFGAWQMLPGTHLSRAIARTGFDWICIDTEHGNIAGMEVVRRRFHPLCLGEPMLTEPLLDRR
jgi:hypothetical protein